MELDSFTENLIQRTQARRDYLNIKLSEINQLSSRKRRTSDTDEKTSTFEAADSKQVDDSPKRQCLETSSEVEDNKEYVDDEAVENKENLQTESDQDNVFVPIHTPGKTWGLAALRKSKPLGAEGNTVCQSPKAEIMVGSVVPSAAVLASKIQPSANSRFAALAADIRSWEDNSSNSSSYSSFAAVTAASDTKESTSVPFNASSSALANCHSASTSNIFLCSENTVPNKCSNGNFKHVDDVAGSSNDGNAQLINSQRVSNSHSCNSPQKEPKQSLKSNKEEQQIQKIVWDQAVLATLESQGFVKSSKSKLSYDFSSKSNQHSTDIELPVVQENSKDKVDECTGSQQFTDAFGIKSPVKPVTEASLELKPCRKQISSQATVSASNITLEDSNKDPAELPLSSRRALFERAFLEGSRKQVENTCESSLSVAQRAALFEKAAKQGSMPSTNMIAQRDPISSVAINTGSPSPMKATMTVEGNSVKRPTRPNVSDELRKAQNSLKPGSPSRITASPSKFQTLTSPLKNIGPQKPLHQQHLNSCLDRKDKETVVKAKEERKNEISALRSHWEKVSSSSADSNSESVVVNNPDQRNPISNMFSYDEKTSLFTEDESSSLEEMPDDSLEDNQCSSSISSELESDEKMASDKSDGDEYGDFTNITGEAVAVCNEMDELLNEELDTRIENSVPLSLADKVEQNQKGSDTSFGNQEKFSSTPKSLNSTIPISSSEGNAKVPVLQYTVSTYRRQKQEAKTTPVRTIKREPSIKPPSPKADNMINIKEEIQVLHNEVLTQQNHISQTSQALNLCRATTEFSGSTEEVEGERLLLIATLKRQSCLNEIQRLRSLHWGMEEDRKGTLTINDIKLPLKRDFISSQLEGNNNVIHYFLCSIRHHAQVVFTQMLSSKDGVSGGCLNFTNHISIHDLSADFSVAFEVYSLQRKKEVLPHEKKYHIKKDHSKLRLTPKGKKGDSKLLAPAVSSPGGPCAVRTPSFSIVGYTRFTIKNCDRKSCTLEKVPFTSPLEGTLHFNVQLHAEHTISMTGFLTMFEDVSGFGAWHRRWCVLDSGDLSFWKYPDEEKKKDPIGVIDLTQCVTAEVGLVSRDICARPHTFQLVIVRPHEKGDKNTLISRSVNTLTTTKHLLSADTKPERIVWCQKLNDALRNVRKWNPHALKPVEMNKDVK